MLNNNLQLPKESSIILVGLVRNAESTLKKELVQWRQILQHFKAVRIYLVESDSSDGTLEILNAMKDNMENFDYVSLGNLELVIGDRIQRLSFCRNIYLEYIENLTYRIDYVVVADFDGINNELKQSSFLSSWDSLAPQWDCCFANQSKLYYDFYALRITDFQQTDIWNDSYAINKYFGDYYANHIFPFSRFLQIKRENGFIEVDSAFGGVAIYRKEILHNKRYGFMDEFGNVTCEHVVLNSQLRKCGYKLFINSNFINAGWTDHTKRFLLVYIILYTKVGRWLSKFMATI